MEITKNIIPGVAHHIQEKTVSNKSADIDKKSAPTTSNTPGAKVEISEDARTRQRVTEIAASAPDIRRDRCTQLKKSINDGTYQVDNMAIADLLVEEHLGTNFGKNEL